MGFIWELLFLSVLEVWEAPGICPRRVKLSLSAQITHPKLLMANTIVSFNSQATFPARATPTLKIQEYFFKIQVLRI